MAEEIYSSYPPQLQPEEEAYLVQTVKNWSIQHGLAVRPSPAIVPEDLNPYNVLATTAPVSLFPSPFPRKCFEQAQGLQTTYNELYAAIANDEAWLEKIMSELIEVDDFLANLWKIHLRVKEEGYAHNFALGLFRSDYMVDTPNNAEPSLKQVEFNTISSSFGGLSALVTALHTELATFSMSWPDPIAYPRHPLLNAANVPPPNPAIATLSAGLAAAHTAYGPSKTGLAKCILFLVQDDERNVFDQLALSKRLNETYYAPCFRLPVSRILTDTMIPSKETNPDRPLIYTPPSNPSIRFEASVVYFRALYAPSEYQSPTSWAARHHLERSSAIKCPTILLHLSGSKKVQQVLAPKPPQADYLKYFLPNHPDQTLQNLRSTFAPQYSLSHPPGVSSSRKPEGLQLALNPATAENHVLKPQREGGGNNIYRSQIPSFLTSIPESQYKQYILMQLIHPPASARNTVLRSDGQVISGNVISELGIFGTCLFTTGQKSLKILHNEEGGYLVRTKARDSDEGGVAAGFSSLDSVILF